MRIRISKADKLFSLIVRGKANWTCERCHKQYSPPTSSLQCSHYFSRGNRSVRFDLENVAALCYGCHAYLGSRPHDHTQFFLKRLGQKKLDALIVRAHLPGKVDEKALVIIFTEHLKRIEKLKTYGVKAE